MTINSSMGKTFRGPAFFAAWWFLVTGFSIILLQSFEPLAIGIGASIMLASGFFIFTTSGVEIETENHRIRQYNKIFGLIKTGNWKNLDLYIGVTMIQMKNIYRIASRANLITSSDAKDYQIFLVNKNRRPAFAIKKCKTLEEAQDSLDEFSIWLKYPVFSPKNKRLSTKIL